jgi:hypothetical protein
MNLFSPIPIGKKLLCKIIRKKNAGSGELNAPYYELYMEGTETTKTFLLSCRKKKKSKNAHYIISLNRFDSDNINTGIVGRVKYADVFLLQY